jgi:hypothetical protein
MDEDPLALENVRLRDQLRKDADALKETRLEFDEQPPVARPPVVGDVLDDKPARELAPLRRGVRR